MAYFTNFQGYLFLCSDIPLEEKQKLDAYLQFLEDSGVGTIIEEITDRCIVVTVRRMSKQ